MCLKTSHNNALAQFNFTGPRSLARLKSLFAPVSYQYIHETINNKFLKNYQGHPKTTLASENKFVCALSEGKGHSCSQCPCKHTFYWHLPSRNRNNLLHRRNRQQQKLRRTFLITRTTPEEGLKLLSCLRRQNSYSTTSRLVLTQLKNRCSVIQQF